MEYFLPYHDALASQINLEAETLYRKLRYLDIDRLNIPEHCLLYFKSSHINRLYFSIETSARLLYLSIKESKKDPSSIHIMDYGAGVGTLYLLAKMIGCRKVTYNDYLESWRFSAQRIAEAIDIQVDQYITGDIETTLKELEEKKDPCDLILSRNVIEHIYDLKSFFATIRKYLPDTIIFSSTTANIKNPGTRWQHKKIHNKIEPVYNGFRQDRIKSIAPKLSDEKVQELASASRGLALYDLDNAIKRYLKHQQLPDPSKQGTNTCDPTNGVWAEHLISFEVYKAAIVPAGYQVYFKPGFWDTHYNKSIKNLFAKYLNIFISIMPTLGICMAPFIYVIAKPNTHE